MNDHTNKVKKKIPRLSSIAVRLLLIGFPIILAALAGLLHGFLEELAVYPGYAVAVYPKMFEYIMMSLALLIGGALLTDYAVSQN